MIIKRTWEKGYGFDRKKYTGYFLFGFIPLYVYIKDLNGED